jgi:hypothetical protein
MDLKAIRNRASSKAGRQLLVARKHSPTVLFGVGVAGVIATAVLASRATLKMDEVLQQAEKQKNDIQLALDTNVEEYNESDAEQDSRLIRVKTALRIVKLYAPAAACGVVTIAALTGSHVIISRRNVGLTAAYAALDRGFREYRARVIGELGADKDQEFRYGVIEKQIAVDTDHGTDVKTVKQLDTDAIKAAGGSIYSRFFDEANSVNWDRRPGYNQLFLQAQQSYANNLLKSRGHVFLNDVLDMLGIDRVPEGQIVGWLNDPKTGDGYIDFGIFNNNSYMGMQFATGNEPSVLLDFNVDGPIWDKI